MKRNTYGQSAEFVADHGKELADELRSGEDRRKRDIGTREGKERRLSAERRKPEVAEIDLSAEEWKRLFGQS